LIDAAGGLPQVAPSELAATTAAAVLSAARRDDDSAVPADIAVLVGLGEIVGLDTLRALWGGAEPVTIAGSLWALYLLRSWCRTNPGEVVRLWSLGEHVAQADAVVAGVDSMADEAAMAALADAILVSLFTGDIAVALERGSAAFRVLAAGRRELTRGQLAYGQVAQSQQSNLADRNERAASSLAESARRWRAGTLA
jgi:hypothetical protein